MKQNKPKKRKRRKVSASLLHSRQQLWNLRERGLAETDGYDNWWLTPEGREVAEELKRQGKIDF